MREKIKKKRKWLVNDVRRRGFTFVRIKLYRSQSRSTTWKNSEVLLYPLPPSLSFFLSFFRASILRHVPRNPPSVLTPWNARSFALLNFKTRFRWRNTRFRSILRYCSPSTFLLRAEKDRRREFLLFREGDHFRWSCVLNYRSIFFRHLKFATLYGIFISEYRSLKFCRFFFFISRFLRQSISVEFLRALVLFLFLSFFFLQFLLQ